MCDLIVVYEEDGFVFHDEVKEALHPIYGEVGVIEDRPYLPYKKKKEFIENIVVNCDYPVVVCTTDINMFEWVLWDDERANFPAYIMRNYKIYNVQELTGGYELRSANNLAKLYKNGALDEE